MTSPRYLTGCPDGSQEHGGAPDASNPAYAWGVNFNYGNSNINHRNNHYWVRPVRASEYQSAGNQQVTFQDLYKAWQRARQQKRMSTNQLHFEAHWIDRLLEMECALNAGTWTPSRPVCFVAARPKAREIHAPDFGDRVVHHWLIPQLEAIYEPLFIAQSFANRKDKGTHAAVSQLRQYVRQVQDGQGCGWYLQLDIWNFFNSIHRPTLWKLLKQRMQRAGLSDLVQRTTHALLRRPPLSAGVVERFTAAERAQVPRHKRLDNAGPGCGLPIGNLSSQFFANVYLDLLDRFIKHVLKVRRYVRYVDDFVLIHESREQLQEWQRRIEAFLASELRLKLKPDIRLRPLTSGVDFLGYVVYPHVSRVRRRVVGHARARLTDIEQRHVRDDTLRLTPDQLQRARSTWASYEGHFKHANSERLRRGFFDRYRWISAITVRRSFDYRSADRPITIPIVRPRA